MPGMEADSSDPVQVLEYYAGLSCHLLPLRALTRSTSGTHLHDLAVEDGNAERLDSDVRAIIERHACEPSHWRSILCDALFCTVHYEAVSVTRRLLLSYRRCGATLSAPMRSDFYRYTVEEIIDWCAIDATGVEFMDVLGIDCCWFDDKNHALHSLVRKPATPALLATVDALGPSGWTCQNAHCATPLSVLIDEGDSERIAAMLPFIPVTAFADNANSVLWYDSVCKLPLDAFREVLDASIHSVRIGSIRDMCSSVFRNRCTHAYEKMLFALGKFSSFQERVALIHASPSGCDPMEVPPRFPTLLGEITSDTDPRVLSAVLEYVVNPWNVWISTKDYMWHSPCTILLRDLVHTADRNTSLRVLNAETMLYILLKRIHRGEDAERADVYGDLYIGPFHDRVIHDANANILLRYMSAEFITHALETVPLGDARHSTADYCQWMHTAVSHDRHEEARVLEAHLPDREDARAYMEQHYVEDVARIYPMLAKRAACT